MQECQIETASKECCALVREKLLPDFPESGVRINVEDTRISINLNMSEDQMAVFKFLDLEREMVQILVKHLNQGAIQI